MTDLVEITEEKFDVKLDLRYAGTNNVCGKKLYSLAKCYLHQDAVALLSKAIETLKKQSLYFKIFDGFRPTSVQKFMFEKFAIDGKCDFISDPSSGSIPHCRGVAIDLTLVDKDGNELEMGSDFDEFSDLASHNCEKISDIAKRNRLLLLDIMTNAGFDFYSKEWWHYQMFSPREYRIQELVL
jgi:D-alanyl-D-alanine dipeptidase